MSSESMISHEVRLLPQCFSANDVISKSVYKSDFNNQTIKSGNFELGS